MDLEEYKITNLKIIRTHLGMSQEKFASQIGLYRQIYAKIEEGKALPTDEMNEMFKQIKSAFGNNFQNFTLEREPDGSNSFIININNKYNELNDKVNHDYEAEICKLHSLLLHAEKNKKPILVNKIHLDNLIETLIRINQK